MHHTAIGTQRGGLAVLAVAQRARGCNGKLEVSAWRGVRNGLINLNLRMANDNILQTVLPLLLLLFGR